jgi:tetratricopeptide (TPR) repeat protein
MSVKVAKNRLIDSSLKGFYQYLSSGILGFRVLGERLIDEAENAQAFRQTDKLEELSSILCNFPLREYRPIGQYYLAWCSCRKNQGAVQTFEQVIETSTRYRARALLDLGTSIAGKGEFNSALKYYQQAIRYAHDHRALTQAIRSVAAVKGIEGFHNQALKDFERIAPIVRHSPPIEKYQYLNSLAVELKEVGRITEARNMCRIVLASPYAFAYPEWHQTAEELRGPNRSFAVIDPSPAKIGKLLTMPVTEPVAPVKQDRPAPVVSLQDWKEKMVKQPNGDDKPKNEKDLFFEAMEIFSSTKISEKKKREMLEAIKKIASQPDKD